MALNTILPFKNTTHLGGCRNAMLVVRTRSGLKKKSSLEDLEDKGYVITSVLGEGSYCKVRAARYKGQDLAVKVITRMTLSVDFESKFLPREIDILTKVKHENIIRVYRIFDYPRHVYMFMERINRGDLLQKIRTYGRMLDEEASFIFSQMLNALRYLHGQSIAHRDLKCENIMITDNDVVKLVDFGFSRCVVDEEGKRVLSETYCGSMAYAAPEVLQGRPYNPMMYDVWSLGCVLFIMMTGVMPFDDSNVTRMVSTQLKKQFKYPTTFQVCNAVKRLISGMLEPDVTKRLTIRMMTQNKWVQNGKKLPIPKIESPNPSQLPGTCSKSTGTQTDITNITCPSCEMNGVTLS